MPVIKTEPPKLYRWLDLDALTLDRPAYPIYQISYLEVRIGILDKISAGTNIGGGA